jgi:hypothetical protein
MEPSEICGDCEEDPETCGKDPDDCYKDFIADRADELYEARRESRGG